MEKEVSEAVLHVLNSRGSIKGINETFIALIPKKNSPAKVSDFRQISLCNVIYKLISKILANKLKKVLPSIISHNLSAFVPGKLIVNNIIVAFETMHTMNCNMARKEGYMAMKLYMSKAYDRIKWRFLKLVMSRISFDPISVDLVMKCTKSVSYSILVHGVPQNPFKPLRGIMQGDPLSIYLFIMCAEALGTLIRKAKGGGLIIGGPFCKRSNLTYIFFADDSLLFCKANSIEWSRMFNLLRIYEEALGKRLSLEKISIQFNKNTTQETQEYILSIAGSDLQCLMKNTLGY